MMGLIIAIAGFFGFTFTAVFLTDWIWMILAVGSVFLGAAVDVSRKKQG